MSQRKGIERVSCLRHMLRGAVSPALSPGIVDNVKNQLAKMPIAKTPKS